MAHRIDRSVNDATKRKISDSMKRYHQSLTDAEKKITNAKRSESAKNYWAKIPPKKTTIQDIMI